jgi:hypothetical protein
MSRTVDDIRAGQAVETLSSSDIRRLSECAVRILSASDGPSVAVSLLQALKLRDDFPDIAAVLFCNDRVRIPDTEKLTLEQQMRLSLEIELLLGIELNPERYMGNPAVKQKIEEYATSKVRAALYRTALRTWERAGRELSYFEKMVLDTTNPQEKTECLNRIIDRIKNGQRYKPKNAEPQGANVPSRATGADGEP